MVIVDFSQIVVANIYAFGADFKEGADKKQMLDILRHTTLGSLLTFKKKYSSEYGEMILACDGKHNWRRAVFPNYKAGRSKTRDESPIDWSSAFDCISTLKQELTDIFPWKVLDLKGCEGDDVIGVMTKYVRDNRTIQSGFFEMPEPVMIISSDGDMKQLHALGCVKQWAPIQKKMVEQAEPDFLVEKIIRGDSGDGICNIKSPNDSFVTGLRQKPITKSFIKQTISANLLNLTEEEKIRFDENKLLIDFSCIPEDIQKHIIDTYLSLDGKSADLNKIMEFLMKIKAKQLLERIKEFKST